MNEAVLLTPPGTGAIAVIRLSGPLNAGFAELHLSRRPRAMRCVHCDLRDGEETIDDAVVVLTGDGRLDLNVHGGPWVVRATLRLAERFGYRVVRWSESVGALDTADQTERQMWADLPAAKSKAVLRLLTAQPAAWAAMGAAGDTAAMRRAIDDRSLERALAVPAVAIVGPPNVGKSTLANALFARERSITADRPGTTRDWVGELADLDGLVVRLIDTPGVRATDDAIEAAAIERAADVVDAADCLVVTIDGSRPLDDAERELLDRLVARASRPYSAIENTGGAPVPPAVLIVRTKADRPPVCEVRFDAIDVCALNGNGLDALRSAIREGLGVDDLTSPHARCWTDDQRYKLRASLEASAASI